MSGAVARRSVAVASWRGLARNFLLGPGPTLHELAHVAVAARYASVTVEPGMVRSRVCIDWAEEVPVWGIIAVYLAPIGLAGGLLIAAAPFVSALAALPWPVQVYLGVNVALLAGPSLGDILELLGILAGGEG